MPECHKCPHAPDVRAGKYRGVPFEQTPCHPCRLSEDLSNHGRSHVSMDSSPAGEHEAVRSAALVVPTDSDQEAADADPQGKAFTAFATALRCFMALSPQTREIVAFRILHPEQSLRVVAKRLGITIQAAHNRLKQAVEKWPALGSVIRIIERSGNVEVVKTLEG